MSLDGTKEKYNKIKCSIILFIYVLFLIFIIGYIVILNIRRGLVENGYKNEGWLNNNYKQICCLFLCLSPSFSLINSTVMKFKYNESYENRYAPVSYLKSLLLVVIISILYFFASSILILTIGIPFCAFSIFFDILLDIKCMKQQKNYVQ